MNWTLSTVNHLVEDLRARVAKLEALAAPAAPQEMDKFYGPEAIKSDPMGWPLPCDVTVGHVTIKKGCTLRTLVLRMQVLYDMAQEAEAPNEQKAPLSLTVAEGFARIDEKIANFNNPQATYFEFDNDPELLEAATKAIESRAAAPSPVAPEPVPYAHHCIWHAKNDDPDRDYCDQGYQQFHWAGDPLSKAWDDDAPDEIIPLYPPTREPKR